ncbi:hypothetical protein J3D55_002365 [Chryseobacterium ginsenosidimutans]|uniref:hypothetical protein n=1 Tax=Chryseobacterium ginsenosidimutans TaxID=687846 RepID=UPI0021685590|nr:hypothetical protein [Chryseobacterium ginsenosidimutans]MCS3869449.1 hypothetical protein [Chryseobacterium ginsenosidimutans]
MIGEISKYLKDDEAIVISKSSIEKRLTTIRKIYNVKTLFHLAVIAKEKKWI